MNEREANVVKGLIVGAVCLVFYAIHKLITACMTEEE